MGLRTTDLRTASYRRFAIDTFVAALQAVFNGSYDRDRQFQNLKITPEYPKTEQDYPAIVVSFNGQGVHNAGIGHVEWFPDETGVLRQWNHRRFQGEFELNVFALSSIDRDTLVDAIIEVISFGWLTSDLSPFFYEFYGNPNDTPPDMPLNQLYIDSDDIDERGNSATITPWRSEDQLVYSTSLAIRCGGGFYNVVPDISWELVEHVNVDPYPEGDVTVTIPLIEKPPPTPLANVPGAITNPRQFYDDNEMPDPTFPQQPNTLKGVGVVSGDEEYN